MADDARRRARDCVALKFGDSGETMIEPGSVRVGVDRRRDLASWMIAACGVWLVGLGVYFVAFRPALLPEDLRFIGTTSAEVRTAMPGLEHWLGRVFTVLGGFMAGAGVLTAFASTAMRGRRKGVTWALALSGVCTVALMSATNFALHSDFRWLLLVPVLLWAAGLTLHLVRYRASPPPAAPQLASRASQP